MIKLIYCVRRLPNLTLEEFQSHWLEHHSQFGRRNPAIRRYVQYHRLPNDPILHAMTQAQGTVIEPYDGAAVAWWDDADAMLADMKSSREVAAALEDEKRFVDQARSVACLTDENVVVEPQGDVPYVLFECLRRLPGMDRSTFQEKWRQHGAIGKRANQMGLLMGYVQNHTLLENDTRGLEELRTNPNTWDGVTTAYFESVAKLKALMATPLASQEAFEDEKTFMDHKNSAFFVSRRHVIKDVIR